MEENKEVKQEKLSYEELNNVCSELHQNYQKLMAEYRKVTEALQRSNADAASFFLSALFRVMEHPNRYDAKFVNWCVRNIQSALTAFADKYMAAAEEEEKKDETE